MYRALTLAPLPVTLLIASFLCPTELSLFLGSLRLPPHRVAIILLLPLAIARLISRGDLRIRSFDVVFLLFALWTIRVYFEHDGMAGLIYGGSLALESFGAYMIARAFVRDEASLHSTLKVLLAAIAAAALFALPETLLGRNFTHDFLHQVTGYHHPTAVETRMGLTRAYGTFDHPIHYGTFCAALLAMLWYAERSSSRQHKRAAFVTGATLLGMSSAPLLCLALQGGMIVWDRVTRALPSRTHVTIAILAGLYIGISMVSNRGPIAIIATGMTLDPWTGFYRLQIWEHGMNNVWAHPWYGIGLEEWARPKWMVASTVDAFWLVVAMRSGIPTFLLLALAIALLARGVSVNASRFASPAMGRMAMGWMMSLIALCLVGATVHYWNVLHAYLFFFIGIGGVFADPKKGFNIKAAVGSRTARPKSRAKHQARPPAIRPPPIPSAPHSAIPAPSYVK